MERERIDARMGSGSATATNACCRHEVLYHAVLDGWRRSHAERDLLLHELYLSDEAMRNEAFWRASHVKSSGTATASSLAPKRSAKITGSRGRGTAIEYTEDARCDPKALMQLNVELETAHASLQKVLEQLRADFLDVTSPSNQEAGHEVHTEGSCSQRTLNELHRALGGEPESVQVQARGAELRAAHALAHDGVSRERRATSLQPNHHLSETSGVGPARSARSSVAKALDGVNRSCLSVRGAELLRAWYQATETRTE